MLSYIFRLIDNFQRQHHVEPNLLYLNELHMMELRKAFSPNQSIQAITDLLGMEVIISRDITHPQVAWMQTEHRIAI